jgi:NADH:ubiquinone oxidoreductase subunit H
MFFVYFYFSFIIYLVYTLFGRNQTPCDSDAGESELVFAFDVY